MLRRAALASVAASVLLTVVAHTVVPARAQDLDCAALRAEINAPIPASPRADQYVGALRQQQYELQRTQNYSASIGCNSSFLFDSGPAECDAIASRIERLQDNIAQLQQRTQGSGDEGYRRRALIEQYNAYCLADPPSLGSDEPSSGQQVMPIDPDAAPEPNDGSADDGTQRRAGHVRALCVRQCDGGYFPITEDASSNSLEQFDQLCKSLCPNAQAGLYTAAPSAGIETAVAVDGTPYTSLPAAFKFEKTFDAACSCKPPHQSWVEALAQAEALIERGKGDVTVTQTMSDAMSRPALAAVAGEPVVPGKPPRKAKGNRKTKLATPAMGALPEQEAVQPPGASGEDLMQQLRRDAPTL